MFRARGTISRSRKWLLYCTVRSGPGKTIFWTKLKIAVRVHILLISQWVSDSNSPILIHSFAHRDWKRLFNSLGTCPLATPWSSLPSDLFFTLLYSSSPSQWLFNGEWWMVILCAGEEPSPTPTPPLAYYSLNRWLTLLLLRMMLPLTTTCPNE